MACIAADKVRTILIATLCAMIAGCAWIEETSSSYDDREDVIAAGMFEKGWIPKWLPHSATRLREKHAFDTSVRILRFDFAAKDTPPFSADCETTTSDRIEMPRVDAWWWPENEVLMSMPSLYRCADDSGYLAIPAESGTAYFWSNPA